PGRPSPVVTARVALVIGSLQGCRAVHHWLASITRWSAAADATIPEPFECTAVIRTVNGRFGNGTGTGGDRAVSPPTLLIRSSKPEPLTCRSVGATVSCPSWACSFALPVTLIG